MFFQIEKESERYAIHEIKSINNIKHDNVWHSKHAKTVITIRIPIGIIERKHTRTSTHDMLATTFEPRIVPVDKPKNIF